ncbi:hypothetical protein D3C71_2048610 [compost metagenome]
MRNGVGKPVSLGDLPLFDPHHLPCGALLPVPDRPVRMDGEIQRAAGEEEAAVGEQPVSCWHYACFLRSCGRHSDPQAVA